MSDAQKPTSGKNAAPAAEQSQQAPAFSAADCKELVNAAVAGGVAHLAGDIIDGKLDADALQARIQDAKIARAACEKAGVAEKANEWLAAGMSSDQIKAKLWDDCSPKLLNKANKATKDGLLSVLAGQDEQTEIQSQSPAQAPQRSPQTYQDSWRSVYKKAGIRLTS